MNIGFILENHRWFNIIEETFPEENIIRKKIFNMDHEFILISFENGNNVWSTVAMGASIAVSMAEKLIQDFNCDYIFRIGTAGSLVPEIKTGEICISYAGIKGEGTSNYYINPEVPSLSNIDFTYQFKEYLELNKITSHIVLTYTTDGRWKENHELIEYYMRLGAKSIDMESSALLSMGMDRNKTVQPLSIITDSPLEDTEEFIGLIKVGVWEDIIMPTFIRLFSVCISWCKDFS